MASYSEFLLVEIASVRYALIVAYERKDRMLYIEAPALRQEYMEKVGYFEEQVLKAELENTLLEQKVELIQAAINRREPIDDEQINEKLDALRQQLLEQAEADSPTASDSPHLSEKEQEALQSLYKEIVEKFHPAVHNDLTDTQKALYDKAMAAYKQQNVEALQLAHDMLTDESTAGFSIQAISHEADSNTEMVALAKELSADYTLARLLWPCFEAKESEMLILEAKSQYVSQLEQLSAEIEHIQSSFPFSAREMLRSAQKIAEYMEELRVRLRRGEARKAELLEMIERKTDEASDYV